MFSFCSMVTHIMSENSTKLNDLVLERHLFKMPIVMGKIYFRNYSLGVKQQSFIILALDIHLIYNLPIECYTHKMQLCLVV